MKNGLMRLLLLVFTLVGIQLFSYAMQQEDAHEQHFCKKSAFFMLFDGLPQELKHKIVLNILKLRLNSDFIQTKKFVFRDLNHIESIEWSADKKSLIVEGQSFFLQRPKRFLIATDTNQERQELKQGSNPTKDIFALSPCSKMLFFKDEGDKSKGAVYALEDQSHPIRQLADHTDEIMSAAFSPDGKKVLIGLADATAWEWNIETESPLLKLRGHEKAVRVVMFSYNGTMVLTGSDDGTVNVWDEATGRMLHSLNQELKNCGFILLAAFSPDDKEIAIQSIRTPRDDFGVFLSRWEVATGKAIEQYLINDSRVSFDPVSYCCVTLLDNVEQQESDRLQVVDIRTRSSKIVGLDFSGKKETKLFSVAVSPDRSSLFVGGAYTKDIIPKILHRLRQPSIISGAPLTTPYCGVIFLFVNPFSKEAWTVRSVKEEFLKLYPFFLINTSKLWKEKYDSLLGMVIEPCLVL